MADCVLLPKHTRGNPLCSDDITAHNTKYSHTPSTVPRPLQYFVTVIGHGGKWLPNRNYPTHSNAAEAQESVASDCMAKWMNTKHRQSDREREGKMEPGIAATRFLPRASSVGCWGLKSRSPNFRQSMRHVCLKDAELERAAKGDMDETIV